MSIFTMKRSKYFLLGLLMSLFSVNFVYSECPTPLSWDFYEVPFNGEYTEQVVLSVNPLCILHYTYCWRTTELYYDFAITEVSLEGECDQFKNLDTLIKYASRDLVSNHNPWGSTIPECPNLSPKHWRMSTAACFSDFYWDPITLMWTSIPCGDDGQERWCWSYYQYCWYWENGQQFLRGIEVERVFGGAPCPTNTSYGLGCNQRCQ